MSTGEIAVTISAAGLAATLILNAWRGSRSSGADAKTLSLLDIESKRHTEALATLATGTGRQDEINGAQLRFNERIEEKMDRVLEAVHKSQGRDEASRR